MRHMWDEFKDFAMKGNALDLAIGVIIGAAFSPIVVDARRQHPDADHRLRHGGR